MIEGNGGRLDSFEERILSYLRENRGTSFTAFQVANYTGTAGAGLLLGKSSGYAVGVPLVRNPRATVVVPGQGGEPVTRTERWY